MFLKQKPQTLDQLVEIAKIQSTESSNKIEGIVTTSTRIKQLINNKTTPRNRDEEEILGYRNALNIIHENFDYIPITPNYILQLHLEHEQSITATADNNKTFNFMISPQFLYTTKLNYFNFLFQIVSSFDFNLSTLYFYSHLVGTPLT